MADRAEKCAEPKDAKYWLKAYKRPILQRMMYSDALSGEDLALLLEEFAEFRSHYPDDRELLKEVMDALCNSAQIIDVVKWEWVAENCWSEWDESVRKSIRTVMQKIDELLRTAAP